MLFVNATVANGNTGACLAGRNVLHGTSAQDLPRPARRNDLERADGGKAQQRGVAGDEQVGPAGSVHLGGQQRTTRVAALLTKPKTTKTATSGRSISTPKTSTAMSSGPTRRAYALT